MGNRVHSDVPPIRHSLECVRPFGSGAGRLSGSRAGPEILSAQGGREFNHKERKDRRETGSGGHSLLRSLRSLRLNRFGIGVGRAGFTLVELMLVMAILASVVAISAPQLTKSFRGRNPDLEARRLISLTRYGASRAISEGVPMLLWFDINAKTYGLEQEPGYADNDPKALTYSLASGLKMSVKNGSQIPRIGAATFSGSTQTGIRFQPDGTLALSSLTAVGIQEGSEKLLWVVQMANGEGYEIRNNYNPNGQ